MKVTVAGGLPGLVSVTVIVRVIPNVTSMMLVLELSITGFSAVMGEKQGEGDEGETHCARTVIVMKCRTPFMMKPHNLQTITREDKVHPIKLMAH